MIDVVATICIFVNDQDQAKAFYTEKLGFEQSLSLSMGSHTFFERILSRKLTLGS